ncbi:MAG: type IV pilus modification PilV family protein [Endomicrobiales bacterium]
MRKDAGFTLVEVLVSSTIMAIVMIYGAAFFTFAQTSSARAKYMDFALKLAKDEIEATRAAPYVNGSAIRAAQNCPYPDATAVTFVKRVELREHTEYVAGGTPQARYQVVAVTVTWTANGGGTVALHTIKGNAFPFYAPHPL